MNSIKLHLSPSVVNWAIERSGVTADDFFNKNPKFKVLVSSIEYPKYSMLEAFAKKTRIPFGYLFLDKPLYEELPLTFFRTLGLGASLDIHINVRDTITIIKHRQDWLTEYLLQNEVEPLAYVGKYSIASSVEEVVQDIRRTIGIDRDWTKKLTKIKPLEYITKKIEAQGVLISYNGVVGNDNTREIPLEHCRGFVLSNPIAPFIFINNKDAEGAKLFTLMHELAHIWIGQSTGADLSTLEPANNPIEVFCNKVASELLVPQLLLREVWAFYKGEIAKIAKVFKVSKVVIARRALDLQLIDRDTYLDTYEEMMNTYFTYRSRQKDNKKGHFYNLAIKRVGRTFANYVKQAVANNQLLYRDAYNLTGLYSTTFDVF